jgi:hypothetical protein
MSRSNPLLRPLASLLLLLAGTAALAQSPPPQDAPEPAPRARAERPERGLPDSVRRVERETGGEVLRAEPMQRDGREVYRFKVLTSDGRVRVMQDDPNARRDDGAGERGKRSNSKEKRPSRDRDGEPPQF